MKRKYIPYLSAGIFFAVIICAAFVFRFLSGSHKEGSPHSAEMSADAVSHPCITISGQKIALWSADEQYYAFLPSACSDVESEPELPKNIDPDTVVWMHSNHIPAVFINTQSGTSDQINSDKNVKESGDITVLEADGSISLRCSLEYMKGRGNTSYTEFAKKPYQIKFAQAIPFLGMDFGKRWVFISNSADSTLIRNALSRNLAKHLGLAQSEEGTFVDLYLNKEYMGNYYVVEKIEVNKNRLPISDLEKATEYENSSDDLSIYETAWTDTTKAWRIPNNPEDITGGYLIERDFDNRFLKEVEINDSYFITQAKECFIVRSPEYTSEAQIAYINDYVQSVENAILAEEGIDGDTGKSYQELIDVDSFVRKYLLEEVTANYDGGVASSFFYKDSDRIDGKLYAGPIWDYDVSWGNSPAYLGQISTSPERLSRLASHSDSSVWFQSLYAKPEFYQEILACYQDEVSPYLLLLANEILPTLDEITAASAAMDYVRWETQYIENGFDGSRKEQIAFLADYIVERREFLDQAWIEEIPIHKITLMLEGNTYETLYVLHNDTLPEFPQVPVEHARVVVWASVENGAAPNPEAPVTGDMVFQAVLQ